jgi:hypothetical protein
VAQQVALGEARTSEVAFAPLLEERFWLKGIQGTLGLDFFQPYVVYAHWDRSTLYLRPRGDVVATAVARIGRWGGVIPACPHIGCVSAEVVDGDGGLVVHVVRDREAEGRALEITLDAQRASASPGEARLSPLLVQLRGATRQLSRPVDPAYTGAQLQVVDAAPYLRGCRAADGCVRPLGAPAPGFAPGSNVLRSAARPGGARPTAERD